MAYTRLPPDQQKARAEAVAAAYARGEKVVFIAARMGLSDTQVCTIARRAGLTKRNRKATMLSHPTRIAAIADDLRAGIKLEAILVGRRTSLRTIHRVRKEHQIPRARAYGDVTPKVLAALAVEPQTVDAIAAATGLKRASAQRALYRIKATGMAVNLCERTSGRPVPGQWALTTDAAAASPRAEARPW